MYHTTVKLIALERAEAFLARGWPKGSQTAFAEQAKALPHEIPSHIVAAYDQLKAEGKEAVVGVVEEKGGGGQTPLSQTALARLNEEKEISRCQPCGRFIYLAAGHNLASHDDSPRFAGGHGRR